MPATLITPRDPEFGLPLPIAPNIDLPTEDVPGAVNTHHGWHPRNDERLMSPIEGERSLEVSQATMKPIRTLGGWALRNSWLWEVDRRYHNFGPQAYHRFYHGPEIPTDEAEQFRLVVLACAGVIPRRGIDLSKGEPHEVTLNRAQLDVLRRPTPNQPFGYEYLSFHYEPVWRFLTDYVLRQGLGHVSERTIEEFLDRQTTQDRRSFLGHLLLAEQVKVATAVVDKHYSSALRSGMLDPRVHDNSAAFIKRRLLGKRKRQEGQLFPKLAAQLRQQVGAA